MFPGETSRSHTPTSSIGSKGKGKAGAKSRKQQKEKEELKKEGTPSVAESESGESAEDVVPAHPTFWEDMIRAEEEEEEGAAGRAASAAASAASSSCAEDAPPKAAPPPLRLELSAAAKKLLEEERAKVLFERRMHKMPAEPNVVQVRTSIWFIPVQKRQNRVTLVTGPCSYGPFTYGPRMDVSQKFLAFKDEIQTCDRSPKINISDQMYQKCLRTKQEELGGHT